MNTSMTKMQFLFETMSTLKVTKSKLNWSYDTQNYTRMVIYMIWAVLLGVKFDCHNLVKSLQAEAFRGKKYSRNIEAP